MGKTYKAKTCAYCGLENSSQGGDHVFAREFFPKDRRANLPQVPACDPCNRAKSALEHYILTVFLFGGQHEESGALLTREAPRRLAKNRKLHLTLADGARRIWVKEASLFQPILTIPFDSDKMERLFAMVARGLAAHHWQAQIPQDYLVAASALSATGEALFAPLLRGVVQGRVSVSLGEGEIQYEGAQAESDPFMTVWRFRLYGGVALGGDPAVPGYAARHIWAMSLKQDMQHPLRPAT